jgi:integrase
LRLGELQALRWDDVDLRGKEIHVRHGWDERAKELIEPKSRAGKRVVPIIATLHERLLDLRLELAKAGNDHGYVFGRRAASRTGRPRTSTELASAPHPDTPFIAQTAYRAARRAWKAAELTPIGLHECRHTCASTMIHAMAVSGIVNVKALTEIMGHETVAMTYDRYGHLLPGTQQQIGKATEEYIREHMEEAKRLASLDESAVARRCSTERGVLRGASSAFADCPAGCPTAVPPPPDLAD